MAYLNPSEEDQTRRPYMAAMPTLREAMGPLDNFASGVRQGWNVGQSMFDSGVAGLARAAGAPDMARSWEQSADEQAREAAQYANPDTQIAPWREGGGGWSNAAPWLLNQAGQIAGGIAPLVAGGVAGMAAAPFVPEAIGGAALASGLGMGIASFPQAVGANYQAERDANEAQGLGEVTQDQAQSAAMWGVPSAALNAFAPTKAIGVGQTASQMASRTMLEAAKDVAKVGIDNALATGGQKAIEHSFRPDMSDEDKSKDMFDSIVTGFIGGAGMGAAGEVAGRAIKSVRGDTPTQDLDAITKSILEPEKAAQDGVQDDGRNAQDAGQYEEVPAGQDGLPALGQEGEQVFGQEVPAAVQQGVEGGVSFLDEGQEPLRQEVAPPDVPKQYLVEAERALRDGTLDQRMAAAEQGGDTLRSRAFQHMKNFLVDENGWLAWHGSPHKYDEVDMSKVGTGEGVGAYGRGYNVAEAPGTAELFMRNNAEKGGGGIAQKYLDNFGGDRAKAVEALSTLIDKQSRDFAPEFLEPKREALRILQSEEPPTSGYLYKLDVKPEKEMFLDWDKPLSEQPPKVQEALNKIGFDTRPQRVWTVKETTKGGKWTVFDQWGQSQGTFADKAKAEAKASTGTSDADAGGGMFVYNRLGGNNAYAELDNGEASRKLQEAGIAGIRFSDPVAKKAGKESSNYVVFNSKDVDVLERNGQVIGQKGDDARTPPSVPTTPEQGSLEEIGYGIPSSKSPEITRDVGGAVARFAPSPDGGVQRVATPDAFKQPVDMPAGTPPIEGPKGVAPAVPPLPPRDTFAPIPQDILSPSPARAVSRVVDAAKNSAAKFLSDESGAIRLPFTRSEDGSPLRTPDDINNAMQNIIRQADDTKLGVGKWMRDMGMWVTTRRHQDEMYGHIMPSQLEVSRAIDHRAAVNQRMQALSMANQAFANDFKRKDRAAYDKTILVERAYQLGMDPTKPWEQQPKRILTGDVNGNYRAKFNEARSAYQNLSQTQKTGLLEAIREQYDMHWASKPAAVLYMMLREEELPDHLRERLMDPSEGLINNPDEALDPAMANRHFAASLDEMLSIAKEFLDGQEKIETQKILSRSPTEKANEAQFMAGVTDPSLQKDFNKLLKTGEKYKVKTDQKAPESALRTFVQEIEAQKGKLKEVPYSALVRHGKFGIGFRLATNEDGTVRGDAIDNVRKSVYGAGFNNVVIEPLGKQNYVFIRSDSQSQINNLKNALKAHIDAGEVLRDDFKAGTMDVFDKSPVASKVVADLIKRIKSGDRYKAPDGASEELKASMAKRQAQMIAALNDMMVDLLPETSAAKSEAHRFYVPGFEADPLQALAKQSIEHAQHVSNLLGTSRVHDALTKMRGEWEAAKDPLHENHAYEPLMASLYGSNVSREDGRGIDMSGPSLIDKMQGLNYSYFLGFNPSFAVLQTTQVPMYVIPELAKRHGFMKSAAAIGKVTMPAFKVMRAVWNEANKVGINAIADMPITTEALKSAGLSDSDARFMVHMVNSGGIDTGGLSRSLGHISENRVGGKWDTFTRWAAFMGYYAETFTRVQAALAAKHLFKGDTSTPQGWNDMIKYSHNVINQGLFDYANENKAQAFSGEKSLLGKGTKLATAFQSYWFMALEKMYREMHAIMAGVITSKRRAGISVEQAKAEAAEARRFMLSHIAATSVIAGSLGIPGMTAVAGLYDKFADWADPKAGPHDLREGWAAWTEKVFGTRIGDVIAHGLPRLAGMDWSSRTQEADYIPLSTFMADRDTWRNGVRKQAYKLWGAPEGAMENIAGAIDKINAGDLKGGALEFLPAAGLRNLAKALREGTSGKFRDSRGHVIPNVDVTPSTLASRAVGFTPTALARHNEENNALHRYDASMELDARNLVAPMVEALRDKDQAAFNRMLPKARAFEKMHPGHKIVDRAKEQFKREYKLLEKSNKSGMVSERWPDDPRRKELGQRYVSGLPKFR